MLRANRRMETRLDNSYLPVRIVKSIPECVALLLLSMCACMPKPSTPCLSHQPHFAAVWCGGDGDEGSGGSKKYSDTPRVYVSGCVKGFWHIIKNELLSREFAHNWTCCRAPEMMSRVQRQPNKRADLRVVYICMIVGTCHVSFFFPLPSFCWLMRCLLWTAP